jgi:hypothetical protein
MKFNFSKACKVVRVMNGVAAGTTDQNGTGVDMTGFEGVAFVAALGAITASAVTSLKAQQSDDDGSADDYTDLEGTDVPIDDDEDNKLLILDIYRPRKRYVRPVLLRETANAVIDGIYAVLYGPKDEPITPDASVAETELHVSPDEGTA